MKNESSTAVCYGEILWDMLPDGPQPGGAPLNVAYHLQKLGVATSLISRVGDDEKGRSLRELMKQWGIDQGLLQTDPEQPTSEVLARMNNGNEVSYEIVYPVAWDFIQPQETTLQQVEQAQYFIYGSLASRNPISKNTLLQLLDTSAFKVFDINLRPPFVSKTLLETLLAKADLVKFNEAELDIVQVMFKGTYTAEQDKIKTIQDRFHIPEVVVTKGEFGASYYRNDEAFHYWGTEVPVSDTIGSGDSFLAAFIANHLSRLPGKEMLRNAVAMGGFIATKKGACPAYELSDYQQFIQELF